MLSLVWRPLRVLTAFVLATLLMVPQDLVAQAHVISALELQKQRIAASETRRQNLEIVNGFLSSPQAEKAMQIVHTNPNQVRTAVSNLSNDELARLAVRAQKTQADFAAGSISDRDLLIILVAVLILVVIILAAEH